MCLPSSTPQIPDSREREYSVLNRTGSRLTISFPTKTLDLALGFESAEDDCTETAGGRGRGKALPRSTIEVVGQVWGGDQGPEPERLLHVAQDLRHAINAAKAYERAAFKLCGSKAILSFPLEAGK